MRILAVLLVFAAACGSATPRYAQYGPDQLLEYGLQRAEDRDWNEAARALEQFVFQHPAHPRYNEARFRLAEVYFSKKEYLTAAAEYARLADDDPQGELADDARFRVCEAYERLAPRPQLDQEYTQTAIDHCQSLLSYYPDSEFAPRAREIITGLENRLAEKMFLNGDFYYRRQAYDSAIMVFVDLLQQHPASSAAPKALLRLYEAYQKVGYAEEARETRERLLREFPNSEEAQRVKDAAAPPS